MEEEVREGVQAAAEEEETMVMMITEVEEEGADGVEEEEEEESAEEEEIQDVDPEEVEWSWEVGVDHCVRRRYHR